MLTGFAYVETKIEIVIFKEEPMATIPAGLARQFKKTATALLVLCTVLLVSIAAHSGANAAPAKRAGHVYLMRGIFNVFSLGMDQIAYKLQAAGIAATVANHTSWRSMADDMIANYRSGNREPIILMGHSAGADATISIARRLEQASVPVALIVNFDPVSPDPVPPNVKSVVNYYVPAGWGAAVAADKHFKGQLANVNENATTNHFSIDKDDGLQRQAIARVMAVTGGGVRRGPTKKKPAQQMSAGTASPASPAP